MGGKHAGTTRKVSYYRLKVGLIVASGVTIWAELWYLSPLLFFWARAIQSTIVAFAVPVAVLVALKLVLDLKKED
ncbi:MAG: hypothetical protein P8X87_04800 [Candidatus Bathyarchaeota archaeon]